MEYQNKTKNCQNCKKDFTIESEDFNFYEKIKVPPPTWCPECRMIRRFSFQNTWNVYWRNCDKCKKRSLSIYSPEQKVNVCCSKCWWGDNWDGTEYAMDYDKTRPFLEQVKELTEKTPYTALNSLLSSIKNSEYSNDIGWSKDCYMTFWADFCENIYYSTSLNALKYSSDCLRGYDSELCYEAIGIGKCYRTFFSEECDNCIDVWFSRNCRGCINCIGCVNLSGATNCIFNIKYSKEEYIKKVKELNLESWKNINNIKKEALKFWFTKPQREYRGNSKNLNTTGEYVFSCKNSKEMYIADGCEDCKYCQIITVKPAKDCMDYSGWGNNVNLIYESNVVGENCSAVSFCCGCWPDAMNLQYCIGNVAGKNNFGCVNLKRKDHCILNKQYSKEEYEKLKNEIIEDMKKNPYVDKLGRNFFYGEFFSPEFSKFPYNKSNAMRFFPKTKEEALREGYTWSDLENPTYPTSIDSSDLPDTIKETDDSILNETIGCATCSRAYKIVKGELDLLRKMNLPIPHECPKCREKRRFTRLSPIKLYNRNCAKCNKEIKTAYSPDRPEIVYCVECYQQEVY